MSDRSDKRSTGSFLPRRDYLEPDKVTYGSSGSFRETQQHEPRMWGSAAYLNRAFPYSGRPFSTESKKHEDYTRNNTYPVPTKESSMAKRAEQPSKTPREKGVARRNKSVYGFNIPTSERLRTRKLSHIELNNVQRTSLLSRQMSILDDSNQEISAALILAGFTEKTTTHGVPHIYFATGLLKKTIWTIITLVALVVLCLHLYLLVSSFREYEVSTSVTLKQRRKLDFPAVTICNHNAVKESKMRQNTTLLRRISSQQSKQGKFAGIRRYELIHELKEEFAALDIEDKVDLGHDIDDMLLFCTFNGEECNESDYWYFFNPSYGNCVTFNSGKKSDDYTGNKTGTRTSSQPGLQYGLSITLNVEQYDYMPFLTEAAGAKIVIHNQTEMPFPELTAFSVSTNQLINIGLKKSVFTRYGGGTYGNCTPIDENANNIYHDEYNVKYTLAACLKTCVQQEIVKKCNCYDPEIPYKRHSTVFNSNVKDICSDAFEELEHCMEDVQEDFINGVIPCSHCHDPCEEVVYSPTPSFATWPADHYINDFITDLDTNYQVISKRLLDSALGLPIQTEEKQDGEAKKAKNSQMNQNGSRKKRQANEPPPTAETNQPQPTTAAQTQVDPTGQTENVQIRPGELTEEQKLEYLRKEVPKNMLQINVYYETLQETLYDEQPMYNVYQFASDVGGSFGLWVGWSVITMVEMIEIVTDMLVFLGLYKSNQRNNQNKA